MVEVSTTFHRHQLPHQANFRAWGSYTATARGGHNRSMVPLYALAGATTAPFFFTGPGRAAATFALSASTQPVPSDNLFMFSKDKWIQRGAIGGAIYGAYWVVKSVVEWRQGWSWELPPLQLFPDLQSGGGQGSSLPSIPGAKNGASIPSPLTQATRPPSRGRRGPPTSGRLRRVPYCRRHKKYHWCVYTK